MLANWVSGSFPKSFILPPFWAGPGSGAAFVCDNIMYLYIIQQSAFIRYTAILLAYFCSNVDSGADSSKRTFNWAWDLDSKFSTMDENKDSFLFSLVQ